MFRKVLARFIYIIGKDFITNLFGSLPGARLIRRKLSASAENNVIKVYYVCTHQLELLIDSKLLPLVQ